MTLQDWIIGGIEGVALALGLALLIRWALRGEGVNPSERREDTEGKCTE